MVEATSYLLTKGVEVGQYLCILDRREDSKKNLEIKSLITPKDLDLRSGDSVLQTGRLSGFKENFRKLYGGTDGIP